MNIQNLNEGQVIKNYRELCALLEENQKSGKGRKYQLQELERYVMYHKEGQRFIIDKIYSIPLSKERQVRSDKGLTRDEYKTIKEEFKPLIYKVLLSKKGYSYMATFSDWLIETGLVEKPYITTRKKIMLGDNQDFLTKEFITLEGDSLRKCFFSALDSMQKGKIGKVSWYKKKIGVTLKGQEVELGKKETEEIENIEQELCELFEVSSRNDLMYKNRKKLKEYDTMLRLILEDRYGYVMCYTAFHVVARVGTNEETQRKIIREAIEKYNLKDDKITTSCKDKIYISRKQRAEIRYNNRIKKINDKYYEDTINPVAEDSFVEFMRDINLTSVGTLEEYMEQWIEKYQLYIHKGIKEVELALE